MNYAKLNLDFIIFLVVAVSFSQFFCCFAIQSVELKPHATLSLCLAFIVPENPYHVYGVQILKEI
jgi:hypothetical protein